MLENCLELGALVSKEDKNKGKKYPERKQLEPTCLLGTQVGLSPRFSLSISSALSDILVSSSLFGIAGRVSGLSGIGPSHSSSRRLSSEKRRLLDPAGSILRDPDGLDAGGTCSISSWKMGI